jgi:hypothetical protein
MNVVCAPPRTTEVTPILAPLQKFAPQGIGNRTSAVIRASINAVALVDSGGENDNDDGYSFFGELSNPDPKDLLPRNICGNFILLFVGSRKCQKSYSKKRKVLEQCLKDNCQEHGRPWQHLHWNVAGDCEDIASGREAKQQVCWCAMSAYYITFLYSLLNSYYCRDLLIIFILLHLCLIPYISTMNKSLVHRMDVVVNNFLDDCFHRLQILYLQPTLHQIYTDLVYGISDRIQEGTQ